MFSLFTFRRIRSMLIGLMALALTLVLAQHWGMMLSNSDDPWITRATMGEIHQAASSQGRFWLIPIKLMAQIPYQFGSWEVANSIKMGVNGLVFVTFVCFCSRLTNLLVGLLAGAVWLALIDISPGEYSAFHGFLLMFNIQFAALFLSFTLYLKHLDNEANQSAIITPFLLYAFAILAYEPMLFYAAAYPAMYLYRYAGRHEVADMSARQRYELAKLFVRRHYPLALVVVLYLLLYFGYRAIQPQSPRGIEVSGSLWVIAKTTYLFSIYGLHIEINPLANYLSSSTSARQLVASVVYGVCISVIVFVLIPKIRSNVHPRTLSSSVGICVLLFFVFCPSVLLALTDGYQKWAAFDPHYVGSYFSSFPLALLASMLILYLVGGEKSRYEKILFAGVIYLIFSSAVDNNMRWAQLATENRSGSQLWRSAVAQLRSQGISQLSAATVCAHRGSPLKVKGDDVYWGRYLSEVLMTRVTYVAKPLPNQYCTYRLDFDALKHR